MSNISRKLDETIERYLDNLTCFDANSEEAPKVIREIADLHKLRMDELKLENENAQAIFDQQRATADDIVKSEEESERKKDRWFRFGISAAEIVLPLAVYGVLAYIGYAREFDGTICSSTLKDVLRSIRKK